MSSSAMPTTRRRGGGRQPPSRGLRAQARVFDVTDADACRALAEQTISEHSRIDVLVNNAGLNRRGDLLTLSDDDWSITFAVNVDAMFHLCRAVLPHMIAAGRGAIVNTASQWGLHPAPGHIAYNVSKAAVVSFTQNLARDYAPYNVRVNAVCPGEIHTPMLESGLARKRLTVADLDKKVPFWTHRASRGSGGTRRIPRLGRGTVHRGRDRRASARGSHATGGCCQNDGVPRVRSSTACDRSHRRHHRRRLRSMNLRSGRTNRLVTSAIELQVSTRSCHTRL